LLTRDSAPEGNVGQNFSIGIVFASLVLLTSFVSRPVAAQTSETRPILDVLVFNYSSAPTAVLVKAAAETSQIFARSGIDFAWTYCGPRTSPQPSPACRSENAPGEIRVRVLSSHSNNSFHDSIFGFAIAPTFATVYYDSAQLLLKTTGASDSDLPVIFGSLIAHEIGHLLIGDNQHTASGIMQARWDIQQVQQLLKGALQFTPQQATRMGLNSRLRIKPPSGTSPIEIAGIQRP
jgi:hypothetical protein